MEFLPTPEPPETEYYATLGWVRYWFITEDAFNKIYDATKVKDLSEQWTWCDDRRFTCDRDEFHGSFDDMVNWITFDVQKHHPLVSRDVVEAYAKIHRFETECIEYSSKIFDKNLEKFEKIPGEKKE